MSAGRGPDVRRDSKSERIVQLRLAGKTYAEIVAEVGGTINSARVLYWKRRRKTRRLLADEEPNVGATS